MHGPLFVVSGLGGIVRGRRAWRANAGQFSCRGLDVVTPLCVGPSLEYQANGSKDCDRVIEHDASPSSAPLYGAGAVFC
jgi:hypothetical protein